MGLLKRILTLLLISCIATGVVSGYASGYYDVPENSEIYDDIMLLTELGIVEGVGNGSFQPESKVTRADFVIMLCNAFMLEAQGVNSFTDVNENDYFCDAVSRAASAGIISGKANGIFDPYANITAQEAVKAVVTAYENTNNLTMQISEAKASKAKSLWASGEVDKAITANIIDEEDFLPEHQISRAEAARLFSRMLIYQGNEIQYDYDRPTKIVVKQKGNIFLDTDEVLSFTVETGYPIIEYDVIDFWENSVKHGYQKVYNGTTELSFDGLDFGHYYVYIYGRNADGYRTELAKTTITYLKEFEAASPDENPYGVCGHFKRSTQGYFPDLLELVSKIGIRHIRDDWYWTNIEPQKGVYVNDLMALTDLCSEYNMAFEPVSGFYHPDYDGGARPYTIEGQTAFANFQKAYFELLTNRNLFKRMEMYNEWWNKNTLYGAPISEWDPTYLAELYRVCYGIIKEEHSDAILMGMVAGISNPGAPTDWTRPMLSSGAAEYIDELTIHHYFNLMFDDEGNLTDSLEKSIDEGVENLRKEVSEYTTKELGTTLPWGVTETGFAVDFNNMTEETQAMLYPRLLTSWIANGAQYVHTYELLVDGNNHKDKEVNFGILYGPLSEYGSYVARPAFVTYGVNARMIDNKKCTNKEYRDNIYCYDFTNGKESIKIFNAEFNDPKVIEIKTDSALNVTDIMGTTKTFKPYNGSVYLTIDENMCYVEGNVISWNVCDGIEFTEATVPIVGAEFALSADLSEFADSGITFEVGGIESNANEIVVPASYQIGEKTVRIFAKINGEYFGEFEKIITVDGKYELNVSFDLVKEDESLQPLCYVTLRNRTGEKLRIDSLVMRMNDEERVFEINEELPVGGVIEKTFELENIKMYKAYDVSCRIIESGKMSINDDAAMSQSYAPLIRHTMEIDGVIDNDLGSVPEIDFESMYSLWQNGSPVWENSDDLSGQAWLSYDDENLYIAASVKDDVHQAEHTDRYVYKHDCLQLGIYHEKYEEALGAYDAALEAIKTVSGYHEVAFYKSSLNDNQGLWRFYTAKEMTDNTVWENVKYQVTRDEKTKRTVYEIAFPWSELGVSPSETDYFGVELVVQDSDVTERNNAYYLNGSAVHLSKDRFSILQYQLMD